jgi:sporulation protein YlmC with PRC-barrel domain
MNRQNLHSSVFTLMKKYLLSGVVLAIMGLAATSLISQTQTTSSSSGYIQTSKIIGTKVKTQQGEEVGVVKDVVLDRNNGCMAYTVLSAGGTGSRVTGQAKLVAVPWSVYSVAPDMSYVTVNVDRDRIYNGPAFEYSRIGDPSFTSTVYSTFGVSAGVGAASTTTTGATTTTGTSTQTQAGAYASPGASAAASTSAGVNAPPTASASATAEPSASASASGSPAASPSKSTRGAKGGTTPVSSPRHKGDETMKETGSESPSETTGSTSGYGTKSSKGSKKSSSAEKSPSTSESSAETGESPSGKKSSKKKGTTSETEPSPGGEQE